MSLQGGILSLSRHAKGRCLCECWGICCDLVLAECYHAMLKLLPLAPISSACGACKLGFHWASWGTAWLAHSSRDCSSHEAFVSLRVAGGKGAEQLLVPWMPSVGGMQGAPPPEVSVVGFGRSVHVFGSKQRPKKITIYGSDFRCAPRFRLCICMYNICLNL